jgi:hypothetical protein
MPRDSIVLSDMPQPVLGIECDSCQRREQFDVEVLKELHGGYVKMPELLGRIAHVARNGRLASMIGVGRCTTRAADMSAADDRLS